jgi:hypothetical protein
VKLTNPPEDEKTGRIAVAFTNDELAFNCKVTFASNLTETKIDSSLPPGSIENVRQTYIEGGASNNYYFVTKTVKIPKVLPEMDDATIRCQYKIPGGAGTQVNVTLSVWGLTVIGTENPCKNGVQVTFAETKVKNNEEINVINKIKEDIKNRVGLRESEFSQKITCADAKANGNLRKISDTVKVDGKDVPGADFFQAPAPAPTPPQDPTGDDSKSTSITVIVALVIAGIVALAVVGVWKKDAIVERYGKYTGGDKEDVTVVFGFGDRLEDDKSPDSDEVNQEVEDKMLNETITTYVK